MMSNSARFIILGSERGLGLSASTCSMQIDHGHTNLLYLAPSCYPPSQPDLQSWPAPPELERSFMLSNTNWQFLVKTNL